MREDWVHKGDFGTVAVVGGSSTYHGAVIFAAMAAYRVGVDLVSVIAPRRAADAASYYSPDLITIPLRGDYLASEHLEKIRKEIKGADSLVLGNGAGQELETHGLIEQLAATVELPMVIDADGLRAITVGGTEFVSEQVIVTPHGGELQDLLGLEHPPGTDLEERKKRARELAEELECTVILKGHIDVIADRERLELNETGTPEMTVGGTGDLLAGACGGFLAQGKEPFEAACKAAELNGIAGELAADVLGRSMLASDVLDFYPDYCLN